MTFEAARQHPARGDAASERQGTTEAMSDYELALEGFRNFADDDPNKAQAELGQAQTLMRLGGLAEQVGQRPEARQHYAEAAELLSRQSRPCSDEVRRQFAIAQLQVARFDALAERPDAEATFRSSLNLVSGPPDRDISAVIWHYVGGYCTRRQLPIAALLAHQQCIDEVGISDEKQALSEMREQLLALQDLGETPALLATMQLLENIGAVIDEASVSSQSVKSWRGSTPRMSRPDSGAFSANPPTLPGYVLMWSHERAPPSPTLVAVSWMGPSNWRTREPRRWLQTKASNRPAATRKYAMLMSPSQP